MSDIYSEIWRRLSDNETLDGLGLLSRNGRIDLSEISVPLVDCGKALPAQFEHIHRIDNYLQLTNAKLRLLDFTGANLPHIRFDGCVLEDCVFDQCNAEDWRIWSTSIRNCSFRKTRLRNSNLGVILMEDGLVITVWTLQERTCVDHTLHM